MRVFRWVLALLMLALPALAQDTAPSAGPAAPDAAAAAEWQAVIHSQIQAFRDHDAPTALSYAAASFHQMYPDPQAFFVAIISAGYAPIMESRSESFGPYEQPAPDVVYQDVKIVGNDQSLYEALYRLDKEDAGWRVTGVQLSKTPGVGV